MSVRHSNLMLPTRGQAGIVCEGVINDATGPDFGAGEIVHINGITSFNPGDGYGARDFLLLSKHGTTTGFSSNIFYKVAGALVAASATADHPEVVEFIKCGLTTNLKINDAGGCNHGQALIPSTVQAGHAEGAASETNKVFGVAMEDAAGGAARSTRSFVFYWRG